MSNASAGGVGQSAEVRKVAIASMVGTTIEWYDFYIYGTAAAIVFNQLFFPNVSPLVGTLSAFATFAVGFLFRPLGGAFFGYLGDRVGRKSVLVTTLLIMGIGTALIGLLPTYESIGILAPILLVVLRSVQGLAVGGEAIGAALMSTEHAGQSNRGFFGSFPQLGAPGGTILSASVFAIFSSMPEDQFLNWGWRVPFLLSFVLLVVGLFIRLRVSESPVFAQMRDAGDRAVNPLLDVVRGNPKNIFAAAGMRLSENTVFFILSVFALSYGPEQLGVSTSTLFVGLIAANACALVAIPFWGRLSDRLGRRPVYLFGAILSVFCMFPFFWILDTGIAVLIWLAYVFIRIFVNDPQYAVQSAYFTEMFSTKVRYSGAAVGSQLGSVLGGGFAPFIATALLALGGGSPFYVAVYITIMCLITVGSVLYVGETYKRDIYE